jgi:hypothetical protein
MLIAMRPIDEVCAQKLLLLIITKVGFGPKYVNAFAL